MRSERGALAVLVSWPDPGLVLPHLISRLGADAAAQLYEGFIDDLVVRLCGDPFDAALYAADHEDEFRARYPGVEVRAQRGRGEGRRLRACFEELLSSNARALMVRSTLPDLHPRMALAAIEMLDRRDAVIGPTTRGDFYLLAMREPRDVFRGVRWGTPGVAAQLMENFKKAHLDCGFLPTRSLVETPDALGGLAARLHRAAAPLTHATLQALGLCPAVREVG